MLRLSALTMPREIRCVWWALYEMCRLDVYRVRSTPEAARRAYRWILATAGGGPRMAADYALVQHESMRLRPN